MALSGRHLRLESGSNALRHAKVLDAACVSVSATVGVCEYECVLRRLRLPSWPMFFFS